jgi:ABC-2 type transport system permease protein
MWSICKKELAQFFSSLTGFLAVALFLLLNGLFLFVFPASSVFEYGYATMEKFFEMAPWILLLLVPAITMRSFSEEFRSGTYEILQTRPLTRRQIILGKYLAALLILVMAIIPTLIFPFIISHFSSGGIDAGGIAGSYIGLFFLAAVFTAIGIFCSSLTGNPVVAFLLCAFACFVIYSVFSALSGLPVFGDGAGYYVEMLGIDSHYRSMSRGLIDSRDLVYFISMILFFLYLTHWKLLKR